MKKKFLTKKVIASLLAGGMLYSGGVLLPDAAFDEAVKLVPDMVSVASADVYREITDHIKFDLDTSETDPTQPDGEGYYFIGSKTLKMGGSYSVTLKGGVTGGVTSELNLSITGAMGNVFIESGSTITLGDSVYVHPLLNVGDGKTTATATLSAEASQFQGNVQLNRNSVLELTGGTFSRSLITVGSDLENDMVKLKITGDVTFVGTITFEKSKPLGATDNQKEIEIITGKSLIISADNLVFDTTGNYNNFITNDGYLVLTGGSLREKVIVKGHGVTIIDGSVTLTADKITNSGGIDINQDKELILQSGNLSVDVGSSSSITVGTVKIGAGKEVHAATSSGGTVQIYHKVLNEGTFEGKAELHQDIINKGTFTLVDGGVITTAPGGIKIDNTGTFISEKNVQGADINNLDGGTMKLNGMFDGNDQRSILSSGSFEASGNITAKEIKTTGGTFKALAAVNAANGIINGETAEMTLGGNVQGGEIKNSGILYTNGQVDNVVSNQSSGTMKATNKLFGAVTNKGELFVDAGNVSGGIDNMGTLHLGGEDTTKELGAEITGGTDAGITFIEGKVESQKNINQKTLTIKEGASLKTDLDKLSVGDDHITNNGTLTFDEGAETDSILAKDILGNGQTIMQENKNLLVGENHTIAGTLVGSNGIIDMTERGIGVKTSNDTLKDINNAKTSVLGIGTLSGNVGLKIDIDMANLQSDKLTINAASGAKVTLADINVVKDFIVPNPEVKVPVIVTTDESKEHAIVYVDGDGKNNITYAMLENVGKMDSTKYETDVKQTQLVTNNYEYTFTLGEAGTLNYEIKAAEIAFDDFIKGTMPGYATAEGDNQTVDPSILSLTADMAIPYKAEAVTADMGSTTQNNGELTVNLNNHKLSNMGSDSGGTPTKVITVKLSENDNILNVNGGAIQESGVDTVAGTISENIDFEIVKGVLKFSGRTDVEGKITNKSNGEGKGVINTGILTLKDEVTNTDGLITNQSSGTLTFGSTVVSTGTIVNLGTMSMEDNVTGTGIIDNKGTGVLEIKANEENAIVNLGEITIKSTAHVSGQIDNKKEGTTIGEIVVEDAASLTGGSAINNDGQIDIQNGILTRDITNNGVIIYENGTIKANIKGIKPDGESVLNHLTVIDGNVSFDLSSGSIENDVMVTGGTESSEFKVLAGTVKGTVYNKGTVTSIASGLAHGEKGVYNDGTLTLKGTDDTGKLGSDIIYSDDSDVIAKTIIEDGANVNNIGNGTNGGWIISQKELVIEDGASLTTDVDVVHIGNNDAGPIVNDGTLTFTANGNGNSQYTDASIKDTLQEEIKDNEESGIGDKGTLNFGTSGGTNAFRALKNITQKVVNVHENLDMDAILRATDRVNVDDTKILTISADNLKSAVNNGSSTDLAGKAGIVQLEEGILEKGKNYTITGGKIEILGNVTADVADLKSNKGIENKRSILTLVGTGDLVDKIVGDAGDEEVYGTTVINNNNAGAITVSKNIQNNVEVCDKGSLDQESASTITGSVYVASGGTLTSSGTIKNGAIRTGNVEGTNIQNGKVINMGVMSAYVDNIQEFEQVINQGTLTLEKDTAGGLKYDIVQGGNSSSGTTIIKGVVNNKQNGEGGGKTISQQSLVIEANGEANVKLITNADNLNISSKKITNNKDLVLIGGTLNADVDGAGTTTIGEDVNNPADVTINGKLRQASLIQKDSVLHINASNLAGDVTNNEGTIVLGNGTLDVQISSGESKTGNVEYMGDVNVKKAPSNVFDMKIGSGRKVDFSEAGSQAVKAENSFELGDKSTLIVSAPPVQKVDSSTALDRTKAAIEITGIEGTFIAEGKDGVLKIAGNKLDENGCYVIVGGASVDGTLQPWSTILTDDFGVELVYTSDPRAFGTTTNGVVAVKALPAATIVKEAFCDAPTVFNTMKDNLPVESTERKFLRDANFAYKGNAKKGLDAWNSMANLGSVAGVTQNAVTSINLTMDVMEDHLSVVNIPSGYVGKGRSNRPILMDTVSDMRNMLPEIIPGGETSSVMPQRFESGNSRSRAVKQVKGGGGGHRISGSVDPENQIWASYIHSKETVDGLKAGNATNDSDVKYNGVSVGLDLWSSQKSIGGVYGSYVEGEVDGRNTAATTHNEIDNYSVGIYNRLDFGFGSILFDAGYTHSKNDITQKNLGYEITAKPKVEAYSAGIRYEKLCEAGRSILTPFFAVRYMNVQSKAYENNFGVHYKVEDQDLITIPVGFKWYAEMNPDSKTRFRPSLEAGYNFNINCKNNKQKVTFDGVTDTVKFNAADEGTYYVKVGMEFVSSNTVLGLFYKYTKGDHTKDSQFNVNLAFDF